MYMCIFIDSCSLWWVTTYVLSFSLSVDPSDTDLRIALVHLITVVLGCTPQSNHLWYHMFAPEELVNTYITGFMVGAIAW